MNDAQRCKARSSRTGKPCRRYAVRGAQVCMSHGGASPQVREAARQRLAAMVNPALAELARLLAKADSDAVKMQAVREILDRNGYKLPEKVEAQQDVTIRVEYAEMPMPDQVAKGPEPGPLPLHTNGKAH